MLILYISFWLIGNYRWPKGGRGCIAQNAFKWCKSWALGAAKTDLYIIIQNLWEFQYGFQCNSGAMKLIFITLVNLWNRSEKISRRDTFGFLLNLFLIHLFQLVIAGAKAARRSREQSLLSLPWREHLGVWVQETQQAQEEVRKPPWPPTNKTIPILFQVPCPNHPARLFQGHSAPWPGSDDPNIKNKDNQVERLAL